MKTVFTFPKMSTSNENVFYILCGRFIDFTAEIVFASMPLLLVQFIRNLSAKTLQDSLSADMRFTLINPVARK
jgi:hypothetical protein